jgi:hypothetical protein
MAITFKEAQGLVERGGIDLDERLNRFVHFAVMMALAVRTGQANDIHGMDDTIIAAAVLQKLIKSPAGRKLIGLKQRGKSYDAKQFEIDSEEFAVGFRLVIGELDHKDAITELSSVYERRDIHLYPQVLKTLVCGLEEHILSLVENTEQMIRMAGLNGSSAEVRQEAIDTIASLMAKGRN